MSDEEKTDFRLFMEAMGKNGKQVAETGALIGIEGQPAGRRYRGELPLTETERLAMAAVRAGLPAWTPETDRQIADLADMRAIIERAAGRIPDAAE